MAVLFFCWYNERVRSCYKNNYYLLKFMKKTLLLALVLGALATFGISEASMKQVGQDKPLLKGESKGISKSVSDEVEITISEENDDQKNSSQGKGDANKVGNQGEENQIRVEEQERTGIENQESSSEMGLQKRSEVANRVHELLELSDRVGGIGEQVRVFAQAQNEKIEKIEEAISDIKSRSGFAKFFIGVKTDKVKEAKELLAENKQKLEALKELKTEIKKAEDLETFEKAVSQIEEYIKEIDDKVTEEVKGFSLFGWLFK